MAHTEQHIEAELGSQEAFEQMVKERLRYAVRVALISVLEEEVTAFIGAQPYERNQARRDQRNGHYTRHLETTVGQIADVPVPRTRGGYQTQLFERYHRRRDELDSAIGEMFVKGVSTTKVGQVIETLTGSHRSRLDGFACLPYASWASMSNGSNASLLSAMCMRLLMEPISRSSTTMRAVKCPFWQWWALPRAEKERSSLFGSETAKMSRRGKTCLKISKGEASKRLTCG